ncbi:MAG: type I glutamate--ammonia ligase [Lachnospirales bacterium]
MKTKADVMQIAKDNNVKFISLQFTDIFGQLKNVALTVKHLEKALDNKIMFDGSSIEGFVRIEESDMYLYPDYDSFVVLPWNSTHGKTARLICDCYTPDGKPFVGDPRYVLKRVLKDAKEMGYDFFVGPECEFFLFNTDENGKPTTETNDRAGYFDLGHIDNGENTRRDIGVAIEEMGFNVEASHHEVARGQHEVDFEYDEALISADRIMTFKLVVKTIAKKSGLHATFMPKPIFGIAGNGMHLNMSLFQNGKNVFYDENGENGLSDVAYNFIAGLMTHIKSMTSLTNPTVNSYKRLVPGYEAPCYIAWSPSNRSPLIRVPDTRGTGTRIELRCPDPSANPYLAIAGCLAAGLDGIKRNLKVTDSVDTNIYDLNSKDRKRMGIDSLPKNLSEAITYTKNSDFVKEVLGDHIFKNYVKAKEKEYKEYSMRVSQWELDNYLVQF